MAVVPEVEAADRAVARADRAALVVARVARADLVVVARVEKAALAAAQNGNTILSLELRSTPRSESVV